jgi:hypothetical protein
MLYLNPPFWLINGISLFPDHEDPAQWYFLPAMPRLTTVHDATANVDVPSLQLISFTGTAGSGGFLNCDVDLGLPDGLLDQTAQDLKSNAHLDVLPRLAPVPIVDGSVRLMLLGSTSTLPTDPAPRPGAPTEKPAFVLKMQSAGKPSLYGDENATFSVQLDADGATILQQAIKGDILPIGVIYSLDYFALRPAYSVTAKIDWNRVQTQFSEHFGYDSIFASVDVDKQIDKLIEDQVIDIRADNFVAPESDDAKSIEAQFEEAKAEARDLVKSTFFQSSIPPPGQREPDGWDKAAKLANQISVLAVTGGWSSLAGTLSYRRVDLTRIDQKSLNFSVKERTAVRKTIWPQAHLAGLAQVLKAGVPLDRFAPPPIDLNNPYFQRRKVLSIARVDWNADSVQSIDVSMHYGGQPQNVILEAGDGKDRQAVDWTSIVQNGGMTRPVPYDYKVTFKNADRTQRPVTLDTRDLPGTRSTDQDQLEIVPRDLLYAIADVPITAPVFPWDRYPMVDVECRYTDDANQIHQDQVFRINKDSADVRFRMFLRDPSRRQFDYRMTLYATDGNDVVVPWKTSDTEQVTLRDPFPAARQLVVVPQVDWTTVNEAFVDLSYKNGPNESDVIFQSFEFSNAQQKSQTFSVHPTDPSQTLIGYEIKLLMKDGSTQSVPPSVTADRRLIVRQGMRGHRLITVTIDSLPFDALHIVKLVVDLRHLDPKNNQQDQKIFQSSNQHETFEFDYDDDAHKSYDYKVSTSYDNGMSRDADWTAASGDNLVVTLA